MKKFLLLLLLLPLAVSIHAQLDSMMRVYANDYPQQKIHLHFDRSFYRAGETIWFKSYIMEGFSTASRGNNLYVELISPYGKLIERKVYPVVESSAAGSFDIPATSPPAVFTIRAYTSWMLNFDSSFIYHKNITVLDRNGNTAPASTTNSTTTLRFFPEGGNMVLGLPSTIAFKVNDNYGMPVSAAGEIVDSKNNVITSFSTVHNGMGKLVMTPMPGETYTARWKDQRGTEKQTPLPTALAQGAILTAELKNGKVVFRIQRSEHTPANERNYFLVAHMAQSPVFKSKVPLELSALTGGSMNVTALPSGILQLTLFSSAWQPLAERVLMVNNNEHLLEADAYMPLSNAAKRAKNVVELAVQDTFPANFSIAVTDASIVPNEYNDNIISRLLLTGDLKGYIHEPGYYFYKDDETTAQHLDLVMLTHGWRRYAWTDVLAKKTPVLKHPYDEALTLQAKIFGLPNGVKISNDEQLVAIVEGKDSSKQVVQMTKVGNDRFAAPLIFFDTVKVFYQFQKNRKLESTASILMENNFIKTPSKIDISSYPYIVPLSDIALGRAKAIANEIVKYGSNFNLKGNVLETVTVKTKAKTRIQELDEKYTYGMFSGSDGTSFDMSDPTNSTAMNIFQFLQGRVAGIQIDDALTPEPSVSWRGAQTSLFLNEMPTTAETLAMIPVTDVAYIKTFRPPFMGATGGGSGGAIAVYTRKGGDQIQIPGQGLSRSMVAGYSLMKQFYSPDYSTPSDVSADYRTTLYWQPFVFTDKSTSKVTIPFYNNDITKSFRIVVEGINHIGKMVRIEKVITPTQQ